MIGEGAALPHAPLARSFGIRPERRAVADGNPLAASWASPGADGTQSGTHPQRARGDLCTGPTDRTPPLPSRSAGYAEVTRLYAVPAINRPARPGRWRSLFKADGGQVRTLVRTLVRTPNAREPTANRCGPAHGRGRDVGERGSGGASGQSRHRVGPIYPRSPHEVSRGRAPRPPPPQWAWRGACPRAVEGAGEIRSRP